MIYICSLKVIYNDPHKDILCPLGPLECEAKAMEGVTFAWDMGFRDVVFKCDSKVVSDSINRY